MALIGKSTEIGGIDDGMPPVQEGFSLFKTKLDQKRMRSNASFVTEKADQVIAGTMDQIRQFIKGKLAIDILVEIINNSVDFVCIR